MPSRCLQDVFEDEKLLRSIMAKTGNHFVISLDFGYVLHHCNLIIIIVIHNSRPLFIFKIIITSPIIISYSNQKKLFLIHNNFSSSKTSSRRLGRWEIVCIGRKQIVTVKTSSGSFLDVLEIEKCFLGHW